MLYFSNKHYKETNKNLKTNSNAFSPQVNYTDCMTAAAGEVMPTFAGRGRCMVSAMDLYGR
jgi:hypothetical protein